MNEGRIGVLDSGGVAIQIQVKGGWMRRRNGRRRRRSAEADGGKRKKKKKKKEKKRKEREKKTKGDKKRREENGEKRKSGKNGEMRSDVGVIAPVEATKCHEKKTEYTKINLPKRGFCLFARSFAALSHARSFRQSHFKFNLCVFDNF